MQYCPYVFCIDTHNVKTSSEPPCVRVLFLEYVYKVYSHYDACLSELKNQTTNTGLHANRVRYDVFDPVMRDKQQLNHDVAIWEQASQ